MKIDQKVYELIVKQVNIEFTNHAIYQELSNWCSYNGYNSSAKLYKKQADDELSHRDKFIKYLLDTGHDAPLIMTNSHTSKADTLEKTFKLSLVLEGKTTKELLAIKKACEDSGDYVTSSLMNGYLDEQVEEEALFIDLLDACTSIGLFDKDAPEWAKKQMRQLIENRVEKSL